MNTLKSFLTFLIALVCLIPSSNAQSYSQLIDHGFDNQHLILDYWYKSDSLIILMNHICENSFDCFTINNLNINHPDSIEYYLDLNDIKPGNYHALIIEEDRTVISSHDNNNGLDKIQVNQIDLLYDSLITNEFLSEDSIRYINDGILEHLGEYYVWGEGRDLTTNIPTGHVIKLDSSLTKIIGQWYYSYGDRSSHLTDLQVQPDGHLSFLLESNTHVNKREMLNIIKIDTSGQIIDELSINLGLGGSIRRRFHTLRNGNYVIMNFRETIFGRVQCIDHLTHEVLWDYEFPKGKFNEFNKWGIFDYYEANNGDIIACGFVMEVIDDKWAYPQIVAYALRLTQDGEYVWLKRFLVPNEANPEVEGPYQFNNFTHVMERDNGQLLLIGESTQINRPPPFHQYAWILALDEDDCYKGNCSDTVIIDKRFSSKMKLEIGAKWTYERVWDGSSKVDFQTFEVTDTLTIDTLSCFVISDRDTICTVDNRVFYKNINNDLENGLQLLYDFDSNNEYNTQCKQLGNGVQEYNISVDSITTETIVDGQLINVHYINDECSFEGAKIYEGIGSSYGYPFPCIDFCNDLSDTSRYELTTLRCFENKDYSYRFVDYPCDTTWTNPYTMDLTNTIFSIGDTWTYELVSIPVPFKFNPLNYSIEDTVEWQGVVAFDLDGLYMYERDKQIFFWDDGLGRYIKYYDFSGDLNSYTIDYLEEGQIGVNDIPATCQVTIDSITSRVDSAGVNYDIQNVTFDCTFNDLDGNLIQKIYTDEIFMNIGHYLESPKINLASTGVDLSYFPNGIRCFENDSLFYQFKPYPCDTIFISLTLSAIDEAKAEINVYPNPSDGTFSVEGINGSFNYEVFAIDGKIISRGKSNAGNDISIAENGLYFLRISYDDKNWTERIVINRE